MVLIPPFIYGLFDPAEPKHIRYVGMTETDPERPYSHYKSTYNPRIVAWVRRLREQGRGYEVRILESFLAGVARQDICEAECDFIALARQRGDDLLNLTDGGEGGNIWRPTAEERKAISDRLTGHFVSPETRAKIGAANRRRIVTPETRAKISAASKGKRISTEQRASMLAAHLGAKRSPKTCARISAALKGKTLGRKFSIEHSKKISTALKGRPLTAETRAKLTGLKRSEETKVKMRNIWARRGLLTKEQKIGRLKELIAKLGAGQ